MSKRARTILVTLFFIAFAMTAPAIVLYTQGYRYDWQKAKLEKTGILRIETSPSGAMIFLNDAPTGQTTPASLFRLLPERYLIRLERPGTLPWERALDVRSGETTFASGIHLVSDRLPILQTPFNADTAVFDENGARFAFTRDAGEWKELGIADVATGGTSLLARFGKDAYKDIVVQWSPSGSYVSVAAMRDGAPTLTLYRTSPPHDAIAIHDVLPWLRSSWFHWANDERAIVVFNDLPGFDSGLLLSIDPLAQSPGEGYPPGVGLGLSFEETEIFDANEDAGLAIVTVDGIRQLGFADDTLLELPIPADRILRVAGDRALLAATSRETMLLVDLAAKKVIGTYDADRLTLPAQETGWRDLLLWNDYEIISVDAVSGSRTLITRIGSTIRDVHALSGLPLIAYATDAGITLIERDDIGGRATYDLVRFETVGGVGFDLQGTRILFLGAIGNQHGIYARGL